MWCESDGGRKMKVIQKIKEFLNRPSRKELEERNQFLRTKNEMLEAENVLLRQSDIAFKKETFKIETLGYEQVISNYMLQIVPREQILKEMAQAFADKIVQYAEIEQTPYPMFDACRIYMRLQVVDRKRERI